MGAEGEQVPRTDYYSLITSLPCLQDLPRGGSSIELSVLSTLYLTLEAHGVVQLYIAALVHGLCISLLWVLEAGGSEESE